MEWLGGWARGVEWGGVSRRVTNKRKKGKGRRKKRERNITDRQQRRTNKREDA